ncbi:hypothetical protein AVDCRST_MAG94-1385, partial [uncultured Leptolyngbya sp.]
NCFSGTRNMDLRLNSPHLRMTLTSQPGFTYTS